MPSARRVSITAPPPRTPASVPERWLLLLLFFNRLESPLLCGTHDHHHNPTQLRSHTSPPMRMTPLPFPPLLGARPAEIDAVAPRSVRHGRVSLPISSPKSRYVVFRFSPGRSGLTGALGLPCINRRALFGRQVRCYYADDGCEEVLRRGDAEAHRTKCPFRIEPCPNPSTAAVVCCLCLVLPFGGCMCLAVDGKPPSPVPFLRVLETLFTPPP